MKYSQEELNQILLAKQLDEFYFSVIENRRELLTTEEYEKITRRDDNIYTGASKEEIDSLSEKLQASESLKKFVPDFMKMIYSFAQIRHVAIITMINDKIYDIGNAEFVDLKRNKIVHYDHFTHYYDETNARIKLFTPEEVPQLQQNTVLVDVDDESIVQVYEKAHINQEESEDLTSNFFDDAKGKSYTYLKKK